MSSVFTGSCDFYRDVIAPNKVRPGEFRKISPISRLNFNVGAVFSICFLVQKIAFSIFFLAATLLTLGLHETYRTSLLKNVKETLIYAGAIPLGFFGVLFPQTINEKVLQIPSGGLFIIL